MLSSENVVVDLEEKKSDDMCFREVQRSNSPEIWVAHFTFFSLNVYI